MKKIINRWNTFSRAGKAILIVLFLLVVGPISFHQVHRVHLENHTYTLKAVQESQPSNVTVSFSKGGKAVYKIDSGSSINPEIDMKYKYDQKSLSLKSKLQKGGEFEFTSLKKKLNGNILADVQTEQGKMPVELILKK